MKIIVTGGAGFIGPHLTERLLHEGRQVMILDDFSAGSKKFIHPQAKTAAVDIRNAPRVKAVFSKFRPKVVFHLAARNDVRLSLEKPADDWSVNVMGSFNILEASRLYKVRKIIFSSSAAVYGHSQCLPCRETECLQPISPYGAAKATFEHYLRAYQHSFGLEAISLRYSNVYGPRQGTRGEGGVVAIFCKRLLAREPLVVFGSGSQTRDFIFVSDVVESNLAALKAKKNWAIYNVATGRETSVNELTKRIKILSDKGVRIKHAPVVAGEIGRSVLANGLIKRELGWSPRVALDEGLKRTWEWFVNSYKP